MRSLLFLFLLQGLALHAQNTQYLSLSQALAEAQQHNFVLKINTYTLDQGHAYILTAKLRPNPLLNNQSLQLFNNRHSFSVYQDPFLGAVNHQIWFQITKPMLLGGLRQKKINYAFARYEIETKTHQSQVQDLCFQTANQWNELWLLKKKMEIYAEVKKYTDQLIQTYKTEINTKEYSTQELLRKQLLSDHYIIHIKTSKLQYENQLRDFNYLLGRKDTSANIDAEASLFTLSFPLSLDSLMAIMRTQRCDLEVLRKRIEASRSQESMQKALALPKLEAGFIYNPQNRLPYAGIFTTLSLPIFDRNQGEIKYAQLATKKEEATLTQQEYYLRKEVENAFQNYHTHKQIAEEVSLLSEQSKNLLQTAQTAYHQGKSSLLEFLDIENMYIENQLLLIEGTYNYRKSYIELMYFTGLIGKL